MSVELALLLIVLGSLAAFLSGLLGIGGALMLIPMLLYIPEGLGLSSFDIKAASALGISQVAIASGSATFANLRRGLVYRRLALIVVGAMMAGAFVSGWASQFAPPQAMLAMLALLATLGASSMFLPVGRQELGPLQPPFNSVVALVCGLFVGSVIGMVGGGSFMLIPMQVYVLGIPTRTAMATGLAAVLPTAASGLVGKLLGHQVPIAEAIFVCLLSIPGAQLGTLVSARLSARVLRRIYSVVIFTVSIGLWLDVLRSS